MGRYRVVERECRMEWLRPAEIVAEMRERPLVFMPVGPLEWHGPHLPLGTDALDAQAVALRVAQQIGGVVLPTLFCGTDRERSPEQLGYLGFEREQWIVGMDFPANTLQSLYFREEYVALLVREMLTLLIRQGYRLIVIVNGHGADNHVAVLERLSAEFTAESPARVIPFFAWASQDDVLDVGHADVIETSRMMALRAEAVDLSILPPVDQPLYNVDWGIVDARTFRGDPTPDFTMRDDPRTEASPELGETTFELSVSFISRQVADALREMGYAVRMG